MHHLLAARDGAKPHLGEDDYPVVFEEREQALGSAQRDNNMRPAVVHVMADAAVSLLVIGATRGATGEAAVAVVKQVLTLPWPS